MSRTCLTASALVLTTTIAVAQPKPPSLPWQTIADCAAAYQANWQNRMSGYNRSRDMSNMIQVQSDDYKTTAVRTYQQETNASPAEAKVRIEAHIAANVARYIAMDKADTLEEFIEKCPQLDPEAPN
jgi:hypothetical protein